MKYNRVALSKPIPVKLDKALLDRIDAASERMGEPRSTIMRMAMRVGLDGLEKAFEVQPASLAALAAEKPQGSKPSSSTKSPGEQLLEMVKKRYPKKPAPPT